jgi:hypothetical protein
LQAIASEIGKILVTLVHFGTVDGYPLCIGHGGYYAAHQSMSIHDFVPFKSISDIVGQNPIKSHNQHYVTIGSGQVQGHYVLDVVQFSIKVAIIETYPYGPGQGFIEISRQVEVTHGLERAIQELSTFLLLVTDHVVCAARSPGLPGAPDGTNTFHPFHINGGIKAVIG